MFMATAGLPAPFISRSEILRGLPVPAPRQEIFYNNLFAFLLHFFSFFLFFWI